MERIAFAGWIGFLLLPSLLAQSVVFVSPSTQGQHSLACSADSLKSFEELHYLAIAHYLADRLCARPHIAGAVGLWHGQAENSGMIDGCPEEKAREVGALLGKYYDQKAALIFARNQSGHTFLVSFRVRQQLRVVSTMMKRVQVSGATVVPGEQDRLILMVATSGEQQAKARHLCSLLHGHDYKQEPGTAELIGDEDRARARAVYNELLAHAPAEVKELDHDMYTERFSALGLETAP